MPTRRRSKYHRLAAYLAAQPAAPVTCTFAAIEAVMGGPLPGAAFAPAWWYRPVVRVPRALAAVGWRVVAVDIRAGTVTFERVPDMDA